MWKCEYGEFALHLLQKMAFRENCTQLQSVEVLDVLICLSWIHTSSRRTWHYCTQEDVWAKALQINPRESQTFKVFEYALFSRLRWYQDENETTRFANDLRNIHWPKKESQEGIVYHRWQTKHFGQSCIH